MRLMPETPSSPGFSIARWGVIALVLLLGLVLYFVLDPSIAPLTGSLSAP
jgi:hypothetical protein